MEANTRRKLLSKQAKQWHAHDWKATRDLLQLKVGQRVLHQDQDSGCWSPAIVAGVAEEPRSYIIEALNGSSIRRDRQHILMLFKWVTFAEPLSNHQDSTDSGCQDTLLLLLLLLLLLILLLPPPSLLVWWTASYVPGAKDWSRLTNQAWPQVRSSRPGLVAERPWNWDM